AMIKNCLNNIKSHLLHGEQKGQSIIIVTFAFLGLIAMLGLALDLGLVYIERVRVSRTADAATLAGVVELPFEEAAMRRAIEYIELNGYKVGVDTEVRVRGCISNDGKLVNVSENGKGDDGDPVDVDAASTTAGYPLPGYDLLPEDTRAVFVIDTMSYQSVDRNETTGEAETDNQSNCTGTPGEIDALYGTANKIRVSGEVTVGMNFMQFFGFDSVPVQGEAVGENVTNLDVAVVFDVSGSMYFETNCFGCWRRDDNLSKNIKDNPYPNNGYYDPLNYKGANIYWTKAKSGKMEAGDLCGQEPMPFSNGATKYFVHEAEFYSLDYPIHGWEFNQRNPGQGFWVLHRDGKEASNDAHIRAHPFPTYSQSDANEFPQLLGGSYNAECFDGPNLSGKCWEDRAAALGEKAPSNVPYVEYDFKPDWDGETHVWIRAAGGSNHSWEWNGRSPTQHKDWRKSVYWQIDDNDVRGGPFNKLSDTGGEWTNVPAGTWRWVYLGSESTVKNTPSIFRLYQGSSGFNVDKILFTNNDSANTVGMVVYYDKGIVVDGGSLNKELKNILGTNKAEGPDATKGSATREACNLCNPAFGKNPADPEQCSCRTGPSDDTVGDIFPGGGSALGCTSLITPTNQLEDDLFHGIDPIRSAQEAVKNFAARLDPKFDQLGFIAYSSNIKGRVKLQCRQWSQNHDKINGARGCFSTDPISYTNVIQTVEDHAYPDGSTNIAQGMREGLEELGVDTPPNPDDVKSGECEGSISQDNAKPCDRRGAARRVLILMTDGSPNKSVDCPSTYKWRGQFGEGRNSYNCAMYFAQQAADNNVTVYTIGIGAGVNIELLTAMATGTDPNPKSDDDGFY
ncbi:MAG: VWA domain-containing protein, partial [Anaerolineae bacterium]|nr:VWA domain-containing protein [Anaerolineae bacterium]